MQWSDVGAAIGKAAPVLADVLMGNIPGAVLAGASLVAGALGVEKTPDAVHAAVLADPQAALKLAQIEADNRVQLQQLAISARAQELAAETAKVTAETARLAEIGATMRAEAAALDPWTRRWRPAWGFVSAGTFAVISCFVLYLMGRAIGAHDQEAMRAIPDIIQQFSLLFSIPGAILGIASYHRGRMQVEQVRAKSTQPAPAHG